MGKSRVSYENLKRMKDLEETVQILHERLHEFEKRKVATADVAERFSLGQRIRDEITPDIRKYGKEYSDLLADLTNPADLPAEESDSILRDALAAVEAAEKKATDETPKEMLELLKQIKEKLNDPGKIAAAKLKVSLPIIPLISAYEMELDTEKFVTQVWRKVNSLFRRTFSENP